MDSLKMQSPNLVNDNIEKIAALFPNCIAEDRDENGTVRRVVDFDLLRQELSSSLVEGPRERYTLSWPGKNESVLTANSPITKTLRPCEDESVDFANTKNIYIEGDNLDALKILQETYLGKVKVIYIDPPYNTGKDFIYNDNFTAEIDEYEIKSLQRDSDGQRLIDLEPYKQNLETNGRFHSIWLSMMFSRLKLSRNLLVDDGVIFVSIHDKEVHNLRKLLDEIFGATNFLACLVWDKNHSAQAGVFKVYHEYVLVYARDIDKIDTPSTGNGEFFEAGAMKRESSRHPMSEFTFPAGVRFTAADGVELCGTWGGIEQVELVSGRMICENGKTKEAVTLKAAYTQKNQMQQYFYGDRESLIDSRGQKISEFYFTSSGKVKIVKVRGVETPQTTLKDYGSQGVISTELSNLFGTDQTPIDNPKPVNMLKDFINWFSNDGDIILDYFSGAATTAHAVMALNAESESSRRSIMVQIPERCDETSTAFKAGYKTIAEIGKERIRRAGKKIKKDYPNSAQSLDIGFRVFKIDSSNMKDVYYTPDELKQDNLKLFKDHIKPDRTPEDLLFQVFIDWGLDLTLPIAKETIDGKTVFLVDTNVLIACFDSGINEELVKKLAAHKPLRAVFRDDAFGSDSVKINVEQIFKSLSPVTEVKSI